MRGTGVLISAKNKLKPIYPNAELPGKLATLLPKKIAKNDNVEGGGVLKEKVELAVAFSKPPPVPPVIGPLVALSLLDIWSRRDGDDD